MPREKDPTTFQAVLDELRAGEAVRELYGKLVGLVGEVRVMGKPGELILKLKVIPPRQPGSASMAIIDEITVKSPKAQPEATTFFADDKNQLSRRDPRQPKLEGIAEVRSIRALPEDAQTGEARE